MANQPPVQDFVSSVDFTGSANLDATELNLSLSSLAGNVAGDNNASINPVITTTDTAANVPLVPDPSQVGALKFKKYLWNRKSFAGATDKTAIIYSWNDDAPNDATFLKWVTTRTDISALQVQTDSNTTAIDSAVIVANQAAADASNSLGQASAANANSVIAVNTANTALANATTANTNATTAVNNSAAAQTNATNALTTATQANTTSATANAAVQLVLPSIANAWTTFNWNGATITLDAKYNVVSVDRISTGVYRVNYVTAFNSNTNMVHIVSCKCDNNAFPTFGFVSQTDPKITTSVIIAFYKPSVGLFDPQEAYLVTYGPLITS